MKKPIVKHKVGDKHFVGGVHCAVRFVNAGQAWLCPIIGDPDDPLVAPHIAYARLTRTGKVVLL